MDYSIVPNRFPEYFREKDVAAAVSGVLSHASRYPEFFTAHRLKPSASSGWPTEHPLTAVEFALRLPQHRWQAAASTSSNNSHGERSHAAATRIHRLHGRTRVLILAGLAHGDVVTTEMAIRLLRHFVAGTCVRMCVLVG